MISQRIIIDLVAEPVLLQDAKEWMQIDYPDFDSLILTLITACREQSEKASGQAYGIKTLEISGNEKGVKVYPTQPYIEDVVWVDEDGDKKYRYRAGFTSLPMDLKVAILQRVATGFAYRQNGLAEAINVAVNQSIHAEQKYTYLYV